LAGLTNAATARVVLAPLFYFMDDRAWGPPSFGAACMRTVALSMQTSHGFTVPLFLHMLRHLSKASAMGTSAVIQQRLVMATRQCVSDTSGDIGYWTHESLDHLLRLLVTTASSIAATSRRGLVDRDALLLQNSITLCVGAFAERVGVRHELHDLLLFAMKFVGHHGRLLCTARACTAGEKDNVVVCRALMRCVVEISRAWVFAHPEEKGKCIHQQTEHDGPEQIPDAMACQLLGLCTQTIDRETRALSLRVLLELTCPSDPLAQKSYRSVLGRSAGTMRPATSLSRRAGFFPPSGKTLCEQGGQQVRTLLLPLAQHKAALSALFHALLLSPENATDNELGVILELLKAVFLSRGPGHSLNAVAMLFFLERICHAGEDEDGDIFYESRARQLSSPTLANTSFGA